MFNTSFNFALLIAASSAAFQATFTTNPDGSKTETVKLNSATTLTETILTEADGTVLVTKSSEIYGGVSTNVFTTYPDGTTNFVDGGDCSVTISPDGTEVLIKYNSDGSIAYTRTVTPGNGYNSIRRTVTTVDQAGMTTTTTVTDNSDGSTTYSMAFADGTTKSWTTLPDRNDRINADGSITSYGGYSLFFLHDLS